MGAPVVRFEIMGGNGNQLEGFHNALFGWKIDSSTMRYGMVDAGNPGGINAGVGGTEHGKDRVSVYIDVDDSDAILAKAEKLDSKITLPSSQVPGGPRLAKFAVPAGNICGFLVGTRVGQ